LNNLTALPLVGGTKEAAIASTFFASFGGHLNHKQAVKEASAIVDHPQWYACLCTYCVFHNDDKRSRPEITHQQSLKEGPWIFRRGGRWRHVWLSPAAETAACGNGLEGLRERDLCREESRSSGVIFQGDGLKTQTTSQN